MTSSLSVVETIHASRARIALCVCGAGSLAAANLTQVAGCSHTLVFAETLYALPAMHDALDYAPSHAVTPIVARQLAQHAFEAARRLEAANSATAAASPSSSTSSKAIFGIGATSAVKTNRTRHGRDRAYVCVWGGAEWAVSAAHTAVTYALEMPDTQSRLEQDGAVAQLILHAVARAVTANEQESASSAPSPVDTNQNGGTSLSLPPIDGCATAIDSVFSVAAPGTAVLELAQAVLDGEVGAVVWNRHGEVRAHPPRSAADTPEDVAAQEPRTSAHRPHPFSALYGSESADRGRQVSPGCPSLSAGGFLQLLYPGSFRPLHWGHTELARAASAVVKRAFQAFRARDIPSTAPQPPVPRVQVTYELAASVVDKGSTSAESLTQRVQQFLDRGERVAITPARLFVEKAQLFPGHGFIVGVDTAERVLDPKYYDGGDEEGMVRALLRDIDAQGCYFVVGGRIASASSQLSADTKHAAPWVDMTSLNVPDAVKHLFLNVPEKEFRVDVSSTELRARMGIN